MFTRHTAYAFYGEGTLFTGPLFFSTLKFTVKFTLKGFLFFNPKLPKATPSKVAVGLLAFPCGPGSIWLGQFWGLVLSVPCESVKVGNPGIREVFRALSWMAPPVSTSPPVRAPSPQELPSSGPWLNPGHPPCFLFLLCSFSR